MLNLILSKKIIYSLGDINYLRKLIFKLFFLHKLKAN